MEFNIIYVIIMTTLLFIMTLVFPFMNYKYKKIPDYKIGIIEHNIESTPIYDILSGKQCEDNKKTSNILGYYFGYESGFEFNSKTYTKDEKGEICDEGSYCDSFKSHRDLIIEYKYFKNTRLCTSKRPNKNYFDYLKYSIGINETCKIGTKKCGKLDVKRILCVKETENCPINDIIYNNQANYTNNNITYNSIRINLTKTDEYIHYTNQKTDNFIITNLTIIGGGESSFPCGSNDNNEFDFISPVDINTFCKGTNTSYKYYFFNKLSSVEFNQFKDENNLDNIKLHEYEYTYKDDMELFSTGYFSLNKEDLKILKKPSDINKNNKYCKKMTTSFRVGWICLLVFGIFSVMGLPGLVFEFLDITILQIIVKLFLILVCLTIIICGIIQIIMKNKLFLITSYIPDFIFNDDTKNIKNQFNVGLVYSIAYSFIVFINIPFLIMEFNKYKNNRKNSEKKTPLISGNEKQTELSHVKENNDTPDTPDTPQPSDNWIYTTQN